MRTVRRRPNTPERWRNESRNKRRRNGNGSPNVRRTKRRWPRRRPPSPGDDVMAQLRINEQRKRSRAERDRKVREHEELSERVEEMEAKARP